MKKTLAILLAVLMLGAMPVFACDTCDDEVAEVTAPIIEEYDDNHDHAIVGIVPISENVTLGLLSYSGVVTEVQSYDDGIIVFIETANEGTVSFYIDENSSDITMFPPTVGCDFTAFFDASLPVPSIYPPRYHAVSYAACLDKLEYVIDGELLDAPAPILKDFTLMVPARAVLEALGFTAAWNEELNIAEVGATISFSLTENSYIKARMAPIQLEAAPVVIDGKAYVPLSFFTTIAGQNNAYIFEGQIVIDDMEKME